MNCIPLHRPRAIACAALMTVAGLAATVPANTLAQPADRQERQIRGQDPARMSECEFRSFKWMTGLDVFNNKGDHVADVSDLIINRGNGRIDYVVLATGSTLGLGGRTIALPYDSFRWDTPKQRFVLDSTEEQLKTYPEFSEQAWTGLTDRDRSTKSSLREWLSRDQTRESADPYAGSLAQAKKQTYEGEVTRIDRMQTTSGEQLIATVRDKSGQSHRVALGPSWFVSASSVAPMRGDKVTINSYQLERSPDELDVGRTITISGHDLLLRDDQGRPMWGADASPPTDKNDFRYDSVTWRSVLASELKGRKVDCRGQECGKVNDLIIDRPSGHVAMLSIDPNQNFLGIGDTKRLVPWSVTSIAVDGTLRIDASKDMVLAGPDTPSDISKLNSGMTPSMVYKAYEVEPPTFGKPAEPGDRRASAPSDDVWSSHGVILRSAGTDTPTTLEGQVTDISRVSFGGSIPPAKAITVNTDQGPQTVLLGPADYMELQKAPCQKGSRVSVEAIKVKVDGKPYLLARRIESGGTSTSLLDASNQPVWDHR